jgi:hypothetical protein
MRRNPEKPGGGSFDVLVIGGAFAARDAALRGAGIFHGQKMSAIIGTGAGRAVYNEFVSLRDTEWKERFI